MTREYPTMGKPEDKSLTPKEVWPDGTMQGSLFFLHAKDASFDRAGKKLPSSSTILGRRSYVNKRYYEEAAIKKIISLIETMPADVRLSRAQSFLDQAFDCLADYYDGYYPVWKYEPEIVKAVTETVQGRVNVLDPTKDKDLIDRGEDQHDPICYLIIAAWSSPEVPVYLGIKKVFDTQISWVTPSDEEFALEFATPLSAEIFLRYARHWDSKNRETLFPTVVPAPKIEAFYDHVGPLYRPEKKQPGF